MLAKRYANNPTLIGYDLMNEPMPGSEALQAQLLMLNKGAELLAAINDDAPNVMELAEQWLTPNGRSHILELLRDINLYAPVADAPEVVYGQFEEEKLMPFYQKVADAIRAVDQNQYHLHGNNHGVQFGDA